MRKRCSCEDCARFYAQLYEDGDPEDPDVPHEMIQRLNKASLSGAQSDQFSAALDITEHLGRRRREPDYD